MSTAEKPVATDILVDTANPEYLDKTIQQWGGVVMNEEGIDGKIRYVRHEDHYVMRCPGNGGFIKFAVENQGYGKIIRVLPELL